MFKYFKSAFIIGSVAILFAMPNVSLAQDAAGPASMPEEISALFADAEAAGSEVSYAGPDGEPGSEANGAAATAAKRYIYTTLRVISNGNKRGCNSSAWGCMTRLCKADLRTQRAWRGWAGCWKKGSKFICYFECGQTRNAF